MNKVHILGLMKSRIYEPNISLISLLSLMLNYAKPRMLWTTVHSEIDHHTFDGNHVHNFTQFGLRFNFYFYIFSDRRSLKFFQV